MSRCLTERELLLSSNRFERVVFGYIVPVVIVIGIAGNVLNFTVLLSPPMRSRCAWIHCIYIFAQSPTDTAF
ncbi:unnamed protein product [Gongylonema pulchrum]|uniref:G_PROTEIN_RECEP_F1_2 domain-containing protein n=1 Tax=Gongylonema pulchrum TaxID=637853 RepID=A0A183DBK5_9BILA|nr:unnamed protein product [Gongylonema pulchrum]